MRPFRYGSETLHIALVSLPQKGVEKQTDLLIKDLYEDYKRDIGVYSNLPDQTHDHLYNPLKYYLFGNYDIALISLVNNYKFSQRQVTPRLEEDSINNVEPNAFQVITGACPLIKDDFSLKDLFIRKQAKAEDFIGISNIKLNNKLLIGNGGFFLEPVIALIDKTLQEMFKGEEDNDFDYFIQQSYSWFEITLVIFSDKIEIISKVLTGLRRLTLKDLLCGVENSDLVNTSLYQRMAGPDEYESINPHLFADTHSYFGVNVGVVDSPDKKAGEQVLKTIIEWEIKPGHFPDLKEELAKIKVNGKPLFSDDDYILTGKMDYLVKPASDLFANNLTLLRELRSNDSIFEYIRKVKTKILLDYRKLKQDSGAHSATHPDFKKFVKENFIKKGPTLKGLNRDLKTLKVSRNVRNKINKIYYNYNNGILDPILFTYFLDFKMFIKSLTELIARETKQFDDTFAFKTDLGKFGKRSIKEFEQVLIEMIQVFEEGYNIRMLNCHHYEDINDFDLDFNSSIQQILSTYNTLSAHISTLFYEKDAHGPVVQLNLKNTVSNYVSINYDVYHLISPEFVFFTLVKEVLNKYVYANDEEINQFNEGKKPEDRRIHIQSIIDDLEKEVRDTNLRDLFESNLIDFEYYFLDSVKFIHTCNLDIELYQYWFWTYNFQNASLFDKIGTMNEEHFRNELIRLFFVAMLFGVDLQEMKCPLPEIYFLWERHSLSIAEGIEQFFQKSKNIGRFKHAILSIFQYPDIMDYRNAGFPDKRSELEVMFRLRKHMESQSPDKDFWDEHEKGGRIVQHIKYALQQHEKVSGDISAGIPVYGEASDTDQFGFITSLIYSYLRFIFEKNRTVRILRRNWQTGKPLISFIKASGDDFLYCVDPFGGIFFSNNDKAADYFRIRNATLQSLWHYGSLCKKTIYF